MKTGWHLAQINIGRIVGESMEDPVMKDFVDQLDNINTIAEQSRGFVWRLKGEGDNATDDAAFSDPKIIVNMSVWESLEDLQAFVYKSQHLEVLKRRKEWFERLKFYMVMWYIPAGTIPTVDEAKKRLNHLEEKGPSPFAFDFKKVFPPPQIESDEKFLLQ